MKAEDASTRIPAGFAFHQDLSRQFISLCTAFVGGSMFLVGQVLPDQPLEGKALLILAWAAAVACIFGAVAVLNFIATYWGQKFKEETGESILSPWSVWWLGNLSTPQGQARWRKWLLLWLSLQWYSFPIAVSLFMWFAWVNLT